MKDVENESKTKSVDIVNLKKQVVKLESDLSSQDDLICSLKLELTEAQNDKDSCARLEQQLDHTKVCCYLHFLLVQLILSR